MNASKRAADFPKGERLRLSNHILRATDLHKLTRGTDHLKVLIFNSLV